MDHESEVIKQQMEETRSSLVEKLEAIEEKVSKTVQSTTEAVTSTVQNTTEAVSGTVEAVKEAVEETVHSVSDSMETVKEAFDLRRQVEQHPWLMMGGAVVVGYLGATLLERGVQEVSREMSQTTPSTPSASSLSSPVRSESYGGGSQWGSQRSHSGLFDQLATALGPTFDHLKGLALGAASGVVGRMVLDAVPESLRGEVEQVINQFTEAVGGKPVPSFLHAEEKPSQSQGRSQNPAQARASAPPPRS